jgi:hypothetical protein
MKGYRKQSAGSKCISDQQLAFGETVQLPGGVPTSRKYTKNYEKDEAGMDADDMSVTSPYNLLGPASGPLNTR